MASTEHSEQLHEKQDGLNGNYDPEAQRLETLKQFRSAASVQMTLSYLWQPNSHVRPNSSPTKSQWLIKKTNSALVGFLLAFTPLACDLMGWRGAGGSGAASNGVYIFMGGLLMIIGGILEWVLGNSFPACVFCSFGGFWFPMAALSSPPLLPMPRFWLLFMGILSFIFFVCSFRTNLVFVTIFFSLMICFWLLTAAFWALASDFTGNAQLAQKLTKAGGAFGFVTCMAGWYIFIAVLFAIVDFPIQIPVGDLSTVIKGHSEKARQA
ncbi:hypothetical protein NM208_g13967 [Fusarium decemcellulare]|uniref:Uncharacterized protein n=1 Tax=Fusarium decemcellulare TaxID=57161 RepID=A0ACC1RKE4_9HYPO|nr:hypothetical protein NM208_g13967 [Fusarium decemcellulare]